MPIGTPDEYDPYGGRRIPRWEAEGQARGAETARQRQIRELNAKLRAPSGGGGGGGKKSTCVCMVMATLGGFGYLYADALHRYIDLTMFL